jgi:basic membrane protein A
LFASAALALVISACQAAPAPAAPAAPAAEAPKATEAPAAPAAAKPRLKMFVNGTLGDKSFFDSAAAGLEKLKADGYSVKIIETSFTDRSKWEPGLQDAAAEDDYDILILGTFDMAGYLAKVAPKYPNKKFWMFDGGAFDFASPDCGGKCTNVYAFSHKQNEGSYVLGVAAATMLKTKNLPNVTDSSTIGIIGGMDIPVIQDFIVGFKQGVKDTGLDAEKTVVVEFAQKKTDNPWGNPAVGKEIALDMYNKGAAIVWGVAGATGNGAFEAAVEKKAFAFGVDSDQYQTIADPAQKATIVTSMVKEVGGGLVRAAQLEAEGKLPYGTIEPLGIETGMVGIADNENFKKLANDDVKKAVADATAKVKSGAVKVDTAFK